MRLNDRSNAPFAYRGSRGLSLIELMVSLTLGLFLIAGMLTLLARNSNSRAELDRRAAKSRTAATPRNVCRKICTTRGFMESSSLFLTPPRFPPTLALLEALHTQP